MWEFDELGGDEFIDINATVDKIQDTEEDEFTTENEIY